MTKMRENMAGIFAVFAVMFIVYIIFDWGMDLLGRRSREPGDVIGSVNGHVIHYKEFSDVLRNLAEVQRRQTGRDVDEEENQQMRDQAWTMLVNQALIDQEMKRIGVTVTDQEIVDWVESDHPPEFLVKQFTDTTGTFNRSAYEAALREPQNSALWVQIENALRRQRAQEKFQSAILASVRVSEGEVRDRFNDQNLHLNLEYVFFDANRMIADSAVTISDEEIKKYYDEHQKDFKQHATRRLKYVLFPEVPSHEDTMSVIHDLEDLARQAKNGADFQQLVKTYSELPLSDAFFNRGELSGVKDSVVFNSKVGEIVGPVQDFDGFHVLKVLEERQGKNESIRASHILLRVPAGKDSVDAWKKARDVFQRAKRGEDFAALAHEFSIDGNSSRGGDLGWFRKGRMVKPFEDAAFKAKVGEIVGPVRTQFGLHILTVTGRSTREVKLADLFMSVKPSSQTKSQLHDRASDFQYLASEGDFDKEAALSKYDVRETPRFSKGGVIPGVGFSDEVQKFAFQRKLGDLSEVLRTSNGYGVFKITEVKDEGVQPLEEVKEAIRGRLLLGKKIEKVWAFAKEIRNKLQPTDSLGVVTKLDSTLKVLRSGEITPQGFLPGVGRDNDLIGKAVSMKVGEISPAFAGQRGCFILKVLNRTEPDSAKYHVERKGLQDQLLQEKRSQFLNEWLSILKEKSDIVDNRDRYYR